MPRQPPQPVPESKPPGIRVVRGPSPSIPDRVSMVWSNGQNIIAYRVNSIYIQDELYMVIDSGASVNCCYPSFAQDYPLAPLEDDRLFVNAGGVEIKQHGVRCVLVELVPNFYVWMKLKV